LLNLTTSWIHGDRRARCVAGTPNHVGCIEPRLGAAVNDLPSLTPSPSTGILTFDMEFRRRQGAAYGGRKFCGKDVDGGKKFMLRHVVQFVNEDRAFAIAAVNKVAIFTVPFPRYGYLLVVFDDELLQLGRSTVEEITGVIFEVTDPAAAAQGITMSEQCIGRSEASIVWRVCSQDVSPVQNT
jgi:hypothetical protein